MAIEQKNIIIIISTVTIIVIITLIFLVFIGKKNEDSKTIEKTEVPSENIIYEQENGEKYTKKDIEKQRENFYKENPLVKYLPYYNDHFEIRYSYDLDNKIVYKIKLNAILNKPSQFEQYKEDYLKYKIEAIEWIKSKGIDYTKLNIEWEPEDPKNINFSLEVSPVNQNNTCQTCR